MCTCVCAFSWDATRTARIAGTEIRRTMCETLLVLFLVSHPSACKMMPEFESLRDMGQILVNAILMSLEFAFAIYILLCSKADKHFAKMYFVKIKEQSYYLVDLTSANAVCGLPPLVADVF